MSKSFRGAGQAPGPAARLPDGLPAMPPARSRHSLPSPCVSAGKYLLEEELGTSRDERMENMDLK